VIALGLLSCPEAAFRKIELPLIPQPSVRSMQPLQTRLAKLAQFVRQHGLLQPELDRTDRRELVINVNGVRE
jgi:hypothetical protein